MRITKYSFGVDNLMPILKRTILALSKRKVRRITLNFDKLNNVVMG